MKRTLFTLGVYYVGLVIGYRLGIKRTAAAVSEMLGDAGVFLVETEAEPDCGDPNCPVHGDGGRGIVLH